MASRVDVGAMMRGVSELDTGSMRIKSIPLDQLQANDNNFFAVDDVQELADNIALHGLDNPLTVCRAERLPDGRQIYRIVAGHRRRKAVELLGWQTVPCNIKTYEDADSEEIALIQSNMTARELTYYERMVAVVKLSEAYARMKERGADLSGRLRDHVVEKSKQSASAVQRMTYIYHHLSAPLMEYLKKDKLTEAVADEMAHCPENLQASFAEKLSAGQILTASDIKAARVEKAAPKAPPETQALKELDRDIRKAVEKAEKPAEAARTTQSGVGTGQVTDTVSIWHPYPEECPADDQKVLVCKYHKCAYYYSTRIYRGDNWYLPTDPTCKMSDDVCWWSAALPPLD